MFVFLSLIFLFLQKNKKTGKRSALCKTKQNNNKKKCFFFYQSFWVFYYTVLRWGNNIPYEAAYLSTEMSEIDGVYGKLMYYFLIYATYYLLVQTFSHITSWQLQKQNYS